MKVDLLYKLKGPDTPLGALASPWGQTGGPEGLAARGCRPPATPEPCTAAFCPVCCPNAPTASYHFRSSPSSGAQVKQTSQDLYFHSLFWLPLLEICEMDMSGSPMHGTRSHRPHSPASLFLLKGKIQSHGEWFTEINHVDLPVASDITDSFHIHVNILMYTCIYWQGYCP